MEIDLIVLVKGQNKIKSLDYLFNFFWICRLLEKAHICTRIAPAPCFLFVSRTVRAQNRSKN